MKDFFDELFSSGGFMPHGHCYLWEPGILWTHVISDGIIALSYFAIPLCLVFIAKKRTDIKYRLLLVLFGIFIYSCGTTHLMNIVTVWKPIYWVDGLIKVITAVTSMGAAFVLVRITPQALINPTKEQWERMSVELRDQEEELAQKNTVIRQSAQALKESEEKYNALRDLFDSVMIQQQETIVYANPATTELIGVESTASLLGRSFLDFVHPAQIASVQEKMATVKNGRKFPLSEISLIRPDGKQIDTEALFIAFTYDNKQAVQIILQDITERKQHEKELKESEAKFRGLFESGMIGTMFWELDGKVTDANDALLEMIGYTREDVKNGTIDWVQMTPPEYASAEKEAHRQITTTGIHAPYEKEYICKDGSRIPIMVGGSLIKGFTSKGVSYIIDITGRKQQERILRESEAKFRHMFELDILGVIFSDTQNRIIEANNAFLQMLGYSREELGQGMLKWDKITSQGYENKDRQAIESLMKTGVAHPYEKEYIRKDGERVSVLVGAALLKDVQQVVAFILDITGRKKQEMQLQQSEAKFRRLFESNLIGIKFSDKQGNILEANNAFLQMLGYTPEDLTKSQIDWISITPPEYAHMDQKAVRQLETIGEVPAFEKEYIRKDGSRVPVIIGMAMLKDSNQAVSFMLDISDRKAQEKQLQESEAKFRGVFESDMMGVVFADHKGKIVEANNAFLDIVNYTRQDLQQGRLRWNDMTPPEYTVQDAKGWAEILNVGLMTPFEKEYIRKDGKRVSVLIGASLLRGYTDLAVAFVLDISQEVQIREELQHRAIELQHLNAELEESQEVLRLSESRFKRMFEMDLIGIVFWDKQGNLIEVNDLFLQIVGYTREDWLQGNINWIQLTPPEFVEMDQEKLSEMDATGVFTAYEKEYFRKDGSRVPIMLAGAVLEGFKDRGVSYILDITNLKKVQKELEQRARELARSNDELEQFAYIASHDLQEPIRTMAGFANLLEKKYKDRLDKDAHDFIGFIVDAADRMKKLISTLLEYSRVNTRGTAFAEVEAEKIVSRVISILSQKIAEAGATITWDPLPVVHADENQLGQVFEHLMGNAIKFRDDKPLKIHIRAEDKSTHWQFAISDTGIGIDMAYAQRIFQVFQRLHTRDKYEGTGIGLAICKRIIDRHHGNIWVESVLDEGSTFYFTIIK